MKTLNLFIVCIVTLTACTPKAQLVTLRGNNVQPAPEGLVLDNDTLTLRYNFSSERGQMHISLVNKLNKPLYVDWKRSAFIIGQDKLDYWYDVADVNLATSSFSPWYGRYRIGSITGTITKDDPVTFIPPQTKIDKQQFVVFPNGTLRLPGKPEVVEEKSVVNPSRKKPIAISVFNYSVDQSPFQFRNYLTLSTDKDFKNEFVIDTKFWASDVRVLPMGQITGVMVQPYEGGTYTVAKPFNKPDGFYIPLPIE
ncbi:hypothetical protein ACFSUS_19265 [Spirosoma soli]|uniref:Uncharacterized protein n=1 Tax=Spirosoma soli TaxID=1770529 RepID=A0ABW5M9B9_9BACT